MSQTRSNLAKPNPTANSAGFSLLEVLATLAVTSLLILALTPLTGQMLATWARGSETARAVELKVRGLGRLREDLRDAIAWSGFGQSENLLMFRGTETSLSFPVVSGLGFGRHGVEMISVTVDSSIDGRALVRRRAPLIGTTYGHFADPVVLFSGPFKYTFRYYGQEGRRLPIWANRNEPPTRVELVISDRRGPVFAAPIEMPVFASLSAGCVATSDLPGCPSTPKSAVTEWMKEHGFDPEKQQ